MKSLRLALQQKLPLHKSAALIKSKGKQASLMEKSVVKKKNGSLLSISSKIIGLISKHFLHYYNLIYYDHIASN